MIEILVMFIWWLFGFVSCAGMSIFDNKEYNRPYNLCVSDLVIAMVVGCFGPLVLIMAIMYFANIHQHTKIF